MRQYRSVYRSHTLLIVLTTSVACGSGASSGKSPPVTDPVEMKVIAQIAPTVDAGEVEPTPVDPPKLACGEGTTLQVAPAPEPTYFCARETGVRHGPFVSKFPDDKPEISGAYKEGKLDGPWERHYPSGAIAEQGAYANGMKDGKWRQLGPTGTVLGEYIDHHVQEEEGEMFPKCRRAGMDLAGLAEPLAERKSELMAEEPA